MMSPPSIAPTTEGKLQPLLLALLMVVTVGLYWQGLRGPFLLDDWHNLLPVQAWLKGDSTLVELLGSKLASPYGRPVAMASFAASAAIGGFTPFAFKAGNLLVHLACGLAVFALVKRLAARDKVLAPHAANTALVISALWLLHPLHASTVLYAVQRMAQLSALWMLVGMWAYMVLRERFERAPSGMSVVVLAMAMAMATALAFFSKENGVLLPAMCLLLELVYFTRLTRPNGIRILFGIGVFVPALVGTVIFALEPARLLGAYEQRNFTLGQRLLTEARALCDYIAQTFIPNPVRMGIYTDDFPISTGLLAPPSTLLAILFLMGVSVVSWRMRAAIPALAAGWGIFLLGHALESTFLPLELYFEHRNYLPMLGLLYGMAGTLAYAWKRSGIQSQRARRGARAALLAVLAVFAFATHGRAGVWSDERTLVEAAAAAHPRSMRAQLAVVSNAVSRRDLLRAHAALAELMVSDEPRVRMLAHLNRLNLDCAMQHQANPDDLASALRNAPHKLEKDASETFDLLLSNTRQPCQGASDGALGWLAAALADRAVHQPNRNGTKAEIRHAAASFYARAGDWTRALPQARLAWQPGMPAATSQPLIRSQLASNDFTGAERTWQEAAARATPEDQAGLRWLQQQIEQARAKAQSE